MERYCDYKIVLAYWDTSYRLVNQGIDIFIAKKNEQFIGFLKDNNLQSWAIVTAWNPGSELMSEDCNSILDKELIKYMEALNYDFEPALGIPSTEHNWKPEESFFVKNISLEQACELGSKYHQKAIVFGKECCLPSLIWLAEV